MGKVKIFSMNWKVLHNLASSLQSCFLKLFPLFILLELLLTPQRCKINFHLRSFGFALLWCNSNLPNIFSLPFCFNSKITFSEGLCRPRDLRFILYSSVYFILSFAVLLFFSLELIMSYSSCLLFVFSTRNKIPQRQECCLFCSLGYSQCQGECLAHSKFSINMY